MNEVLSNIDLGKTRINEKIRVSSAAIFYPHEVHQYYQLETWIFSDDKELQRSTQIIHGTCGTEIPNCLIDKTKKVHGYVADGLNKKFNKINS